MSLATMVELEAFYQRSDREALADRDFVAAHGALIQLLEAGELRAAQRTEAGAWEAVAWVKRAILLGFRGFELEEVDGAPGSGGPSFDRGAYLPRRLRLEDRVRMVPGGSAVRRGAHVAAGVVIMPPAYINVGAWVGTATMIDSHVLVGSCAQVGAGVHLSAGVQLGGVLEPAGSRPVVVEDGAFLGAQSGVFEGVVVGERAVLAPGVSLTGSTVIFDLVQDMTRRGRVPAGAVVVPGTRPARGAYAESQGLALYAPVIVKYRDATTDAATALEESLR